MEETMRQLICGGPILTMAAPMRTEAVLTEDGVILALGSPSELAAQLGSGTVLELRGRTLLPAFIDAHSHLSQVAASLLQISLQGAETPAEAGRCICAYLREHAVPGEQWVIASGYDPAVPGVFPSLEELDAWAPDNPLAVQSASGHSGCVNSPALQRLEITAGTPDPPGGVIGRRGRRLTGCLEENAWFAAQKKIPAPSPEKLPAAYGEAQMLYASNGITLVQEGLMTAQMLPLYRTLLDSGVLRLDVVGYADPESLPAFAAAFPRSIGRFDRHFRLGGLKIFLDGSPQGHTAWMRTPYADRPDSRGCGAMTDAAVTQAMEQAARGGWQLLAHCNGDAAAEQYLRCLADAERRHPGLRALRTVLIHGQLLGADQLEEVRRLGVIPSFFVAHVYHWGDVHLRSFGPDRAERISPAGSALRRGISFTFHQDAPVVRPDMPETLWCAVNRRTKSGRTLGPGERIPVQAALRAVTANAAYQYFAEGRRGLLAPGAAADFVLLDRDPLSVPPEELRNLRVLETWRNGQRIFSR